MHLFLPIALGLALGSGDPESAASMHAFLPRGITSFGAAQKDGWVYILGGYDGQPHAYSREGQRGEFFALNPHDPRDMRGLPGVEPLQSVTLVAHPTGLIRVGGMRAHNSATEEADLRSVAEVARFDVARGAWSALPSLPRPRSSHDAVIAGDQLVVVGGWMLTEAGSLFHAETLVLDLVDPAAGWRSIETPFRARALAAAPYMHDGRQHVLVVGGLGVDRRVQRAAWSLDLAEGQWAALPAFPVDAFGVAAASLESGVIASAKDGQIWRYDPGSTGWESVGSLALGRMFHRIVAAGPARALFIGGIANMEKGDRIRAIELLDLDATAEHESPSCVSASARSRDGEHAATRSTRWWLRPRWRTHPFFPRDLPHRSRDYGLVERSAPRTLPQPVPRDTSDCRVTPAGALHELLQRHIRRRIEAERPGDTAAHSSMGSTSPSADRENRVTSVEGAPGRRQG